LERQEATAVGIDFQQRQAMMTIGKNGGEP
jgi:hypothetical protein